MPEPTPPSDHRTRELGARFTSGDECYPAKVTVGDFMKVLERPASTHRGVALLYAHGGRPLPLRPVCALPAACCWMPMATAMWRFSRPAARMRYAGLGTLAGPFVRTAWRALLCADILHKMLLMLATIRESARGDTEAAYGRRCRTYAGRIEAAPLEPQVQLHAVRDSLVRGRDRFRKTASTP